MSDERQTVWRESARIRSSDGSGYSDSVTDEQIRQHLADNADDRVFVAFAAAVLAIRRFERVA